MGTTTNVTIDGNRIIFTKQEEIKVEFSKHGFGLFRDPIDEKKKIIDKTGKILYEASSANIGIDPICDNRLFVINHYTERYVHILNLKFKSLDIPYSDTNVKSTSDKFNLIQHTEDYAVLKFAGLDTNCYTILDAKTFKIIPINNKINIPYAPTVINDFMVFCDDTVKLFESIAIVYLKNPKKRIPIRKLLEILPIDILEKAIKS